LQSEKRIASVVTLAAQNEKMGIIRQAAHFPGIHEDGFAD
jgi:hypothetical protein